MEESKTIEYYNSLELKQWSSVKKYEFDGLKVVLDLHVSENNEDDIVNIGFHYAPLMLRAIQNNISEDIKKAMIEKDITILLTDVESVKIRYQKAEVEGCYDSTVNQVVIGLPGVNPIVCLFHEIGHFIDDFIGEMKCSEINKEIKYYSEISDYVQKAFENESDMFREYGKEGYGEFVAVAFENYFTGNLHSKNSPMTMNVVQIYLYLLAAKYGNTPKIDDIKNTYKDIEKIIYQ